MAVSAAGIALVGLTIFLGQHVYGLGPSDKPSQDTLVSSLAPNLDSLSVNGLQSSAVNDLLDHFMPVGGANGIVPGVGGPAFIETGGSPVLLPIDGHGPESFISTIDGQGTGSFISPLTIDGLGTERIMPHLPRPVPQLGTIDIGRRSGLPVIRRGSRSRKGLSVIRRGSRSRKGLPVIRRGSRSGNRQLSRQRLINQLRNLTRRNSLSNRRIRNNRNLLARKNKLYRKRQLLARKKQLLSKLKNLRRRKYLRNLSRRRKSARNFDRLTRRGKAFYKQAEHLLLGSDVPRDLP